MPVHGTSLDSLRGMLRKWLRLVFVGTFYTSHTIQRTSKIVYFTTNTIDYYRSHYHYARFLANDDPGLVRAQNKPKPSIMIPFQRDSTFVGREDILADLRDKLEQAASQVHSRVALIGPAGVG